NFFTASPGPKPNAEQPTASGPRPSSYTSSWSGNQNANRTQPANGAAFDAGAAAGDSERRIQDLLAAGENSQSTGDRRAARTAFEQVLKLAPGDASANYQLAIMDDEEGRFADAERHYFTVMRQTPHDPNVLSSMGWSYLLQGRFDDSDRVLREALRYDPDNKFALNNLGMLYGTRGDYDGALTIFRMAGSEADAQQALAMLKQNVGTVPAGREQYPGAPVNFAKPAAGGVAGNPVDSRGGTEIDESEFKTPQARKFVQDYKRLKAENDRQQQEKRARLSQKNMSAPSPWNNNRHSAVDNGVQRDSGRAIQAQGLVGENTAPSVNPAVRVGPADPIQIYGRNPPTDAAFPGAAPVQSNQARRADPADFGPAGNAAISAGTIPPFNPGAHQNSGRQPIPGTQAVYEQPTGVQPQGQSNSPIITPKGEAPASRGNNSSTWNSLPPDESYRGNPNGRIASPSAGRLPEWPQNSTGNPGAADQSLPNSAGQFNSAQQRGGKSRQDAQSTAAQLGLSAGSDGMGFPASDWSGSQNGQAAVPGNGPNPSFGQSPPGSQIPPSGQNSPGGQFQGNGPATSSPNGPNSNGNTSGSPGSSLPPWPDRPLSGGSVPLSVVPSAQGLVYGSTGDSGMPNFYSKRPALPPIRQP
ncbi:MAG TPA: tetratricopeptide repeat protein, partial [Pirellulaceae bacterium]|nr:tetratricopeptide repeat protein [Pirellulaceae bacterium]